MDDTHTHLPLSGDASDSDRYKRFRQTANERCTDHALSIFWLVWKCIGASMARRSLLRGDGAWIKDPGNTQTHTHTRPFLQWQAGGVGYGISHWSQINRLQFDRHSKWKSVRSSRFQVRWWRKDSSGRMQITCLVIVNWSCLCHRQRKTLQTGLYISFETVKMFFN